MLVVPTSAAPAPIPVAPPSVALAAGLSGAGSSSAGTSSAGPSSADAGGTAVELAVCSMCDDCPAAAAQFPDAAHLSTGTGSTVELGQ